MRLGRPLSFVALLFATSLALAGCRFKTDTSEALDEEAEDQLAEVMIKRLDRSCGVGGCHASEGGVLYSAAIAKFAQYTSPVHNCFVFNGCYQDDVTEQGAKDCLNRCILDRGLNNDDFNFGIFHAATREGGFVHQLATKAGLVTQLAGMTKMPPQAPAADMPNIADTPKKFKQLADWLTTQMEERGMRSIIALRGRPISDWELPILATAPHLDAECGTTPQAFIDMIDDDFRLNDVKMFGCSTDWPADPNTCLADHPDSEWNNASAKAFDSLTHEGQEVTVKTKLLRKLDGRPGTAYWMRSSPDGRFASTGNGRIEDLAVGGAGGEGRSIIVDDASIDPGFDPSNRYYIWPGMICPIAPLYEPTLTNVGEQIEASKCRQENIGTYASIGNANGTTIEVEGDNSNNYGWRNDDAGVYTGENTVVLREIDPVALTQSNRKRFSITDEADFLLGPAGTTIVNRAVGEGEQQIYRIRQVQDSEGELGPSAGQWYLTDNTRAATVCLKGEKPMTSFDGRFVVFHHHADSSPQDAGATAEHANIFVYDLKTKRYIRATDMKNRSKAYFPHFRADGWLYFQTITYPEGEGEPISSEILASNAALVLKSLPLPTPPSPE